MWQNWLSGFLGLAVIVVIWLNVSLTLEHWFLFVLGFAVAVLNFWIASEKRGAPGANDGAPTMGNDKPIPPIVN